MSLQATSTMRSVDYYCEDVEVASVIKVFRVEDVLFRIPTENLTARTVKFKGIVRDSNTANPTSGSGNSDDDPIFLKGIEAHEFKILLDFITPQLFDPEFSFEELEALLKASALYKVPTARNLAITQLWRSREIMSSVYLLALSFQYRLPGLFREYYSLMASALTDLTYDQLLRLGARLTHELVYSNEKIRAHRAGLASMLKLSSLKQAVAGCPKGNSCATAFQRHWEDEADKSNFVHSLDEFRRAYHRAADRFASGRDRCMYCLHIFKRTIDREMDQEAIIFRQETERVYWARFWDDADVGVDGLDPNM